MKVSVPDAQWRRQPVQHRREPNTCGQTKAPRGSPLRWGLVPHPHLQMGKLRPESLGTGLKPQSWEVAEPGLEPRQSL